MTTLSPYNEILLRHHQNPVFAGHPETSSINLSETNRVCGDHVNLWLDIHDKYISHIGHASEGCLLCRASASILCQTLHGAPDFAVRKLYEMVRQLTDAHQSEPDRDELEKVVLAVALYRKKTAQTTSDKPANSQMHLVQNNPPAKESATKLLEDAAQQVGDILALAEVRKFPTRRKCVMMSWDLIGEFYGCSATSK
jgi:nitrogen fixation NifU-like protein